MTVTDSLMNDLSNQRYNNRYFQLSQNKKCPFHVLPVWTSQSKTRVQLWLSPNNDFFSFAHSLNSPYHLYSDGQFVCHEVWGNGPLWAFFTDKTLISCKPSQRQMNLPTVHRPGLFSAINLINILIMNLNDSTIRLSDFQTWPQW